MTPPIRPPTIKFTAIMPTVPPMSYLENQKQEQCNYQGQNCVFQKIRPNLSACHPVPPSCILSTISMNPYFESVVQSTVLSPPGDKANVVFGLYVRLSGKSLHLVNIASTAPV